MDISFQFLMPGGPIPRIFYDYVTDAPVQKCRLCGDDLLHSDTTYIIEKAIKGTDVLYEIAVCLGCAQNTQQKVSEESAARIQEFLMENVNMGSRQTRLLQDPESFDVDAWLEECLVTGKKRSEISEYTLYGLFHNDQILAGEFPYMISAEALVQISSLLSQETKDEMGRLGDDNLGVPPEFEDLFRKRTPVFL